MDDASFVRFSIGVASATGVLLAILVSIFVLLIGRWAADSRESVTQVRESADQLHGLLVSAPAEADRYFENTSSYRPYLITISGVAGGTRTIDDVMDYFDWRSQTSEITQTAIDFSKTLPRLVDDPSSRPLEADEALLEFNRAFVPLMQRLDDAIQLSDWAKAQRRMAKNASLITYLAGLALVSSLLAAMTGEIRTMAGVADRWNVYGATALLAIVFALVVAIFVLTRFAWTTRQDWLESRIERFRRHRS